MEKNKELSSLIHGQYKNEAEFADHIGWTMQRLHSITSGRKKNITFDDVVAISDGLGVPFQLVADIFLRNKYSNRVL